MKSQPVLVWDVYAPGVVGKLIRAELRHAEEVALLTARSGQTVRIGGDEAGR